jgi:serine/threonine-protein kinase
MERFLKSRYKIGDKISENPFSVTYKGSFLGSSKPVVIKIYKRGTLNSRLINAMKRKVKDLAGINHHNIAKLIDGDYGWQGFYYVRNYIEGKDLQQLLESGQEIGENKAVDIAAEVCRALEEAHAKGIVHGSLKPSNIFIEPNGVVKVADFVIEGEIKEAMPQKIISIMDNGKYASPEELAGNPATYSSDVFSLGMILYQLLGENGALAEKGLRGAIKKLRSKSLLDRGNAGQLPRYLQDILGKALQEDPLLRFSSIEELRESLEHKNIVSKKKPYEEFVSIFEKTVTQYGAEDISRESELLTDVGRVRIRLGKEKHRNWLLALIIGLSLVAGVVYSFLFGR